MIRYNTFVGSIKIYDKLKSNTADKMQPLMDGWKKRPQTKFPLLTQWNEKEDIRGEQGKKVILTDNFGLFP